MIRYLRGTILDKVRNQIILDVQGVGYDIFVTATTLTQAEHNHQTAFHISESIREDAHDLFGFLAPEERDSFESLRKVSGVGPKVALAIIGFYAPAELNALIQSGDSTKLSLVPGIGKKSAEKIIVELKGKTISIPPAAGSTTDQDTVDALQSLGYSRAEIAAMLPKVPASMTSSNERITWILRHLGA